MTVKCSSRPGYCSQNMNVLGQDFGYMREYLGNRHVFLILSPRAGGICIGINLNPDPHWHFNCGDCEINPEVCPIDVGLMTEELRRMLALVNSEEINNLHPYRDLPKDLTRLRNVALSGEGEPTLCPNFLEVLEAVVHLRALGKFPYFRITLLTNASGLDLAPVRAGLRLLTRDDEIWAQLENKSEPDSTEKFCKTCRPRKIMDNILLVGRDRSVIIQSPIPGGDRTGPLPGEIDLYAQKLGEMKRAGGHILLVQIYSAVRTAARPGWRQLPLDILVKIAGRVKEVSGIETKVW